MPTPIFVLFFHTRTAIACPNAVGLPACSQPLPAHERLRTHTRTSTTARTPTAVARRMPLKERRRGRAAVQCATSRPAPRRNDERPPARPCVRSARAARATRTPQTRVRARACRRRHEQPAIPPQRRSRPPGCFRGGAFVRREADPARSVASTPAKRAGVARAWRRRPVAVRHAHGGQATEDRGSGA